MALIPLANYKLGRQTKPSWMTDEAYGAVKQPVKTIPLTLFKAGPLKPQPKDTGFPNSAKEIVKDTWNQVKPGGIDLFSKGLKKYQTFTSKYLVPKSPDEAPNDWKSINDRTFLSGTTLATKKKDGTFDYVDFGGIGSMKNVGTTGSKGLLSKVGSFFKKPSGFPTQAPQQQATDPISKIITALKEAKPLEKAQQALYSAERAKRVARVASIGKSVKGEGGFYAQLGSLKGELPKVQFTSLRKVVDDAADPLTTEARKYKSAEEFGQSLKPKKGGTSLFHGTDNLEGILKEGKIKATAEKDINDVSFGKNKLSLSQDPKQSGKFGDILFEFDRKATPSMKDVREVRTSVVKKKMDEFGRDELEWRTPNDIPISEAKTAYLWSSGDNIADIKLAKQLEDAGVKDVRIIKQATMESPSTVIYSSKSQLTDIWKKAQTVADDSTKLGQADIDELFNMVEKANITPFEKISAKTGLANLLGKDGGRVPTKGEIALLSEVFPPEFTKTLLAKRSGWEKFKDASLETLNIPRSLMASTDLSAPLRQGILMVGKPKQFLPALKGMFKYAVSEKAYLDLVDDIKARPNYLLMRESKLGLTDSISPALSAREEQFMSNFAEKIPGFGKIVKGSNRAYTGFLNKLRADVFDDLVKKSKTLGIEQTPKLTRDIAKYVNTSTGRGELGALQNAAPLLNGLFFSPRLLASRLNVLNPMYYASLEPFARKEALKSLFTFTAIAGTTLGLAKLAGAEVGTEPTSSDFGKIKVKNTRYDIFGGFQQYMRLAAQLTQGKVTSSSSGRTVRLGEGYKPLTRKDIILRFFESKESPIASFATSLLTGKNSMGQDLNLPTEVINRLTPIIIQDMYDLYQEGGLEDLIKGLPTPFGVGTQTYGRTELVEGLNPLGEPTSQVRQVPGLSDAITEKLFGKQPLGSSKSFDVEQYYDQLMKLPREEAAKVFDEISATNPDLAKQVRDIIKDREKGITAEDKDLKDMSVASGDRAKAIMKEFDKLKTKEEKQVKWEEYVNKGIITDKVATQLMKLLSP